MCLSAWALQNVCEHVTGSKAYTFSQDCLHWVLCDSRVIVALKAANFKWHIQFIYFIFYANYADDWQIFLISHDWWKEVTNHLNAKFPPYFVESIGGTIKILENQNNNLWFDKVLLNFHLNAMLSGSIPFDFGSVPRKQWDY